MTEEMAQPEWRRMQQPAANGHGNARSLAGFYAGLLDGQLLDGELLAELTHEHSQGDDLTLLVAETTAGAAPEGLPAMLGAAGLAARVLAGARTGDGRDRHLLEVDGMLGADDARLAGLREPVLHCAWLGGYARPLAAGG